MRHQIHLKALLLACTLAGLTISVGCTRTSTAKSVAALNSGSESVEIPAPPSAPSAGYEFTEPVRLKAGGEFVSVEGPGFACPTMADVDGDNKEDLVVGQFRSGNMQFCKNIGATGAEPKFAAATWVMTGDERAEVPGVS